MRVRPAIRLMGVCGALGLAAVACEEYGTLDPLPPPERSLRMWVEDTTLVREYLDSCGMDEVGVEYVTATGVYKYSASGDTGFYRVHLLELSARRLASLTGGLPIDHLPGRLSELDELRTLEVMNSRIGSLPEAIGSLANLKAIKAGLCGLTSVPESICDLDSLHTLYLNGNLLTRLPDSIGKLGLLNYLELNGNQLDSLPSAITGIPGLRRGALTVTGNYLCTAPGYIKSWLDTVSYEGAGWLAAQRGCAQTVADTVVVRAILDDRSDVRGVGEVAIVDAGRVVSLDLSAMGLSELPDTLFALTALRTLDLQGNALRSIAPRIDSLGQLQSINLRQAFDTSAIVALNLPPNLRDLDLSGNRLTALAPALDTLDSLRILDLSSNDLDTLSLAGWRPPSRLQWLDLSGNRIGWMAPGIGALRELTYLDISHNALDTLPALAGLVSLRYFDASANMLGTFALPDSLRSLAVLRVTSNGMRTLPAGMSALVSLDTLALDSNEFAVLPVDMTALENLRVTVADNRLCDSIPVVVQAWLEVWSGSNWRAAQRCSTGN